LENNSDTVAVNLESSAKKGTTNSAKFKQLTSKINLRLVGAGFIVFCLLVGAGILLITWQGHVNNSYTASGEKVTNACTDILNPNCWTDAFKPTLEQSDGKTNILVLGVDTRSGGTGSQLANTDTILLGTIDYIHKQTRLISLPRDLYAPYQLHLNGATYHEKINQIYAEGLIGGDNHDGIATIAHTVERITGEKIQYGIVVKLDAIIQGVDSIGGIDVNISSSHINDKSGQYIDVYPYVELPPSMQQSCNHARTFPGYPYCIFAFKPGITHMDGQTALIYSRMREWDTDFDRESRQHDVIDAIKNKVLDNQKSVLEKANYLFKLYNTVTSHLIVENLVTAKPLTVDIQLALSSLAAINGVDTTPANIILDPSFAGGGLIQHAHDKTSNYVFADGSFTQVQAKLHLIYNNLDLYKDNPTIYAVNATGQPWGSNPLYAYKTQGLWFVNIVADQKPADTKQTGIQIIDYTNGVKQGTIKLLKSQLASLGNITIITANPSNNLKPTQNKEDIAVYFYPQITSPNAAK